MPIAHLYQGDILVGSYPLQLWREPPTFLLLDETGVETLYAMSGFTYEYWKSVSSRIFVFMAAQDREYKYLEIQPRPPEQEHKSEEGPFRRKLEI